MAVVYYAGMVEQTSETILQAQLASITTRHGFTFAVNKPLMLGNGNCDPDVVVKAIYQYPDPDAPEPVKDASGKFPDPPLTMYRIISRSSSDKTPFAKAQIGIATYVKRSEVIRWDWFYPDTWLQDEIREMETREEASAQEEINKTGAQEATGPAEPDQALADQPAAPAAS